MHTRVKICGITSPEIARMAIDAGADALGLMFYPPSSRYLSLDTAIKINRVSAPFVSQVAVVVNPDVEFMENLLKNLKLDYIQFHGEESNHYCRSFGVPYIKVIRVKDSTNLLELENQYPDSEAILLDTHVEDLYGGSGKSFAWERSKYGGIKPIILAGGLEENNVQSAIQVAKPYAVDVSTGVETDGMKDGKKISRFCERVRAADSL